MLRLRGSLSHLLCQSRDGGCEAAILNYASRQHYLPHFLASSTFASTAAPRRPFPPETTTLPSVFDYLIQSCGFSPDEAAGVCKRLKLSKTTGNAESVVSFFKGKGLDEALVRKVVCRRPALLNADVEKTLAPKFRALAEMGFSKSDLLKALVRDNNLLYNSVDKKLMPNISLLREECGVHDQILVKLLRRTPRLVSRSTSSLKEAIERVRELGIPQGTKFIVALHMTDGLSRSTVDEKLAYFKSLGWSEKETLSAIHKNPFILGFSEKRIKDSVDFFVKEAGCSTSFVAAHPILLTFSIDNRVKPRYNVYQILQSRQLPEGNWSLLTIYGACSKEKTLI